MEDSKDELKLKAFREEFFGSGEIKPRRSDDEEVIIGTFTEVFPKKFSSFSNSLILYLQMILIQHKKIKHT
jgi:hypothetical protein